jgi:MarR family 2-MHQ and catechol resistance regulon transcriptional repressor
MKRTHYKGTKDEARALGAYVKLVRASESVSARIHGHLAHAGLTVSQFGVMEALYHVGPLNQGELAKKILKSSGNITMVIDNLEKRGLVKRERKAGDRRSYEIKLTIIGRRMIGSVFPRHAAKIIEQMNALTGNEQEVLSRLCRKVGLAGDK